MSIKILELVFSQPRTASDVVSCIRSLSAEYDQVASIVEEGQKGNLAQRVYQVVWAADVSHLQRDKYLFGALAAGANEENKNDSAAAYRIYSFGLKTGAVSFHIRHSFDNFKNDVRRLG